MTTTTKLRRPPMSKLLFAYVEIHQGKRGTTLATAVGSGATADEAIGAALARLPEDVR